MSRRESKFSQQVEDCRRNGLETRGAVRASYVVLAACGVLMALALTAVLCNRNGVNMGSETALAAISNLHGVTWPTNAQATAFLIWRHGSSKDGNLLSTETLAKLEMDDDSFSKWYSSATNFVIEDGHMSVARDARLIEKAKWWLPHELTDTNAVLLSHEVSLPTGITSKLRLFTGATGTNHILYLHCHVRHP